MELKPEAARRLPFLLSVQFHPERLARTTRGTPGDFSRVCRSLCANANKIMKGKILIVDDEADMRELLAAVLGGRLRRHRGRQRRGAAKSVFRRTQPDVVLLDVKLPDANGLDLLPQIKKRWPDTEVIVLTGHGTIEHGRGSRPSAARINFLTKPFENEKLLVTTSKCAIERKQQSEENSTLRRALETMSGAASPDFPQRGHAGGRPHRRTHRAQRRHHAHHRRKRHRQGSHRRPRSTRLSPRSKGKIIKINCAALPRELIESELFGSVKGAFTGAHTDREGLFRQAEGGTLLLDEISEMPIDTQSKLLRVLQDQEVRPVGGKTSYKTNCRIIAATNRKPEDAIKDGKLREDLFYRISAISVHLPPLRERRDDIMPLANAFLKRFAAQANRASARLHAGGGRTAHRL